jgi:SAM-dependent methyltransferase
MEKSYYEKYFHFEDDNWWFVGRRQVLTSLAGELADRDAGPILDAGCGTGGMLAHLGPANSVIGIDNEALALSFARRRGAQRLIEGSAVGLPFPDNTFSTVYSLDVLEHLDDDHVGIRELERVCRPGGRIIITVPAFRFLWSQHDVVNQHRRRYRAHELRDLVRGAGLEINLLSYSNTALFPAVAGVRLLKKVWARLTRSSTLPGADNEFVPEPWNSLLSTLYGFERHIIPRCPLPFGVSLVCVATKADEVQPARRPAGSDWISAGGYSAEPGEPPLPVSEQAEREVNFVPR